MNEVSINTAEMSWSPAEGYPGGTMWKVMNRDERGNPTTVILKIPAGFIMDDHTHIVAEHHFVLEGEYESGAETFPTGCYQMIPDHCEHGPFKSTNGAVILVFWS